MACIVLALALGLVGATSFSDAAGFSGLRDEDVRSFLLVLSGIVVFGLTLVLIRILIRLVQGAIGLLARTAGRPGFAVVLTLIISGTVCILASLAAEFYGIRSIRIVASDMGGSVSAQAPLMLTVLAILAFLAGAALVAVGVWGSIHPAPTPLAAQNRAFDTGLQ
jgi:hypothetical protein